MKNVNVWRLSTHHIDRNAGLTWVRKNERIAIGWGLIGDIRQYKSKDEIRAAIKKHYPVPPYKNNAHWGAPSLWDLCHTVKQGDLIILSGATPRTLVVQVVGDYEYKEDAPLIGGTTDGEYRYQRAIKVTAYDPEKIWAAVGAAPGKSRYQTLIQCAQSIDVDGASSSS